MRNLFGNTIRGPARKLLLAGGKSSILNNLVSYWKLDELAGTRFDSHGPNDLAVSGSVTYAAGVLGQALDTNGAAGYLYSTTSSRAIGNAFTFWGWIYPRALTGRYTILTSMTLAGDTPRVTLYIEANVARFIVSDSVSGISIPTRTLAAPNAWYFMAGRYNPLTLKAELRVNALAWTDGTALSNGPNQGSNLLRIGRYSTDNGDCLVDSVGYSGRYLSNAEVDLLYKGGVGLEYPF